MLIANPQRCKLDYAKVEYLGYQIGFFLPPLGNGQRQVKSFLGLPGYYSRFVPNSAPITSPLTDITKARLPQRVRWTDDTEAAL